MARVFLIFITIMPLMAQEYTVTALSRHVLTNDSVIALASAGFDELFIIERIRTSRTRFDTSVDGLIALKQGGISEDVIRIIAQQDIRNYPTPLQAAPAGSVEAGKVRVEKHWWGFRWVKVTR
ncbi:MAG: hypothetical protein ABL995_03295 [Bryobacteraceae bacterium]